VKLKLLSAAELACVYLGVLVESVVILMAKSSRGVPKEIAAFGEKQFIDTGAALVEILRVKASTIRKYYKQLQGVAFLVSVVSLDRVRVYFFSRAGTLVIAENIEPEEYEPIRKKSKLVAKFVKPRPPTPEELRMEATEELRQALSRALRRVSRTLAVGEPDFPPTFVTKAVNPESNQGFGVSFEEDGAVLFEEPSVKAAWSEGIMTRTAFLLLLEPEKSRLPFSECVGNGLALALTKKETKDLWLRVWLERSKDSEMKPTVGHLVDHTDTYNSDGFRWILQLIRKGPSTSSLRDWISGLSIIHENLEVSLGTEDYHTITRFLSNLAKPRRLSKDLNRLQSIHLSARALCDPTPLGLHLAVKDSIQVDDTSDWLSIEYLVDGHIKQLRIGTGDGIAVRSISYRLSINDIFPKQGGLRSQGADIIRWALGALGVKLDSADTFLTEIEMKPRTLSPAETAVLERLSSGEHQVLSHTLVGSPARVKSLMDSGAVSLLPSFHHLGLRANLTVRGRPDAVKEVVEDSSLEATTILSESESIAIIAAPGIWAHRAIEMSQSHGCATHWIIGIYSGRNLVRSESLLSSGSIVT
jgi:hypothetical protein